jgi:uncharacterized protein involved in exopolysaccharide biosynthesis
MSETQLNQDQNSDEIDLKDLILPLWKSRKQVLTIATICGILGGIVGFLTPETYTAKSTFLPQTSQVGGGLSGSLGGLASLAGINLNAPMSGGEIPSSMYATVLGSQPFRQRILDAELWVNGDSISYRSYLKNQPKSVFVILRKYTIGLPSILLESAEPLDPYVGKEGGKVLVELTNAEFELQKSLENKISIANDKKEGVVSLTVVEENPLVAAQVAQATETALQDWIIEHKIKNAKAQYDFIEKQFEAKQKEFFSIQEQLANYTDRNQNVLAASYLTRLDRLQAEFDLVNTVYSELAKQKEQAAIQLSKDTPTFSILDPVKVPKEKTGPKKSLYILGTFLIGLTLASGWALGRKQIHEFFKAFQETPQS